MKPNDVVPISLSSLIHWNYIYPPFFLGCDVVDFSMFFSSFTDYVLQQKISEGRGKYIEADTPMSYGGSWGTEKEKKLAYKHAVILAITDVLGIIVCSWESITVMPVTFFDIAKDPLKPGMTMASESSFYNLSFCNPVQQRQKEKKKT